MDILEKAKEISIIAYENGKKLANIAKLNLDISSLKYKIDAEKKKIGDIVYKEKIKINNGNIEEAIRSIKSYEKEIEIIKEKIANEK